MMQQVVMPDWERQSRVKEYRNDPFIAGCKKQIEFIISVAKPIIKICVTDPNKSIFDIEEPYKKRIEWWKERINEYVKRNYSDIINTSL